MSKNWRTHRDYTSSYTQKISDVLILRKEEKHNFIMYRDTSLFKTAVSYELEYLHLFKEKQDCFYKMKKLLQKRTVIDCEFSVNQRKREYLIPEETCCS